MTKIVSDLQTVQDRLSVNIIWNNLTSSKIYLYLTILVYGKLYKVIYSYKQKIYFTSSRLEFYQIMEQNELLLTEIALKLVIEFILNLLI